MTSRSLISLCKNALGANGWVRGGVGGGVVKGSEARGWCSEPRGLQREFDCATDRSSY